MAGQKGGIGAGVLAGLAAVVLALAGWGVWNAGLIPGLGPTAPESAEVTAEPEAKLAVAETKAAEAEAKPEVAAAKPEESKPETPEVNPETTTPDTVAVKLEPETPALPAPAFDVVRVETDGTTLIAGSAAPGARVVFLLDGTEVGEAVAGTDGKFAAFLSLGEAAGPRVLTMMAEVAGTKLASEDQIILAPVVAEATTPAGDATVVQTSPEATAQPDTTVAEAKPEAPKAEVQPDITVAEAKPEPTVAEVKPEAKPEPTVTQAKPETTASENAPEATVTEVKPDATAPEAKPEPTVAEVKPETMAPEGTATPTMSTTAPVGTDSGTNTKATEATSSLETTVTGSKPKTVAEVKPEPTATETQPDPTVAESKPEPTVAEAKPEPTATKSKPDPTVAEAKPEPTVAEAKPEPTAVETKPQATPAETKPEPTVAEVKPETDAPETKPEPTVTEAKPEPAPTDSQSTVAETKPEPARTTSPVPLLSDQTSAPQAPDATAEAATPGSAPAPVQTPVATSVAVLRATKDGIEVIQPATPQRPEALDQIALEVISYSEEGEVQLAGRAGGQTTVRVYLDNKAVADIGTDDSGQWKGELSNVKPGIYTLRLDALNAGGEVVSRLETPFKRESPEVLNPPSRENLPDNAPVIRAVTVQKGDTLWAISRERYGNGILYVRVFEANKTSIRNPDLIYPGQVFSIP